MQEIFKMTPHDKQVMMFSATLSKEIRPVCKKFMQDVMSHGQLLYFNLFIMSTSFHILIEGLERGCESSVFFFFLGWGVFVKYV